MIMFKKVLLGLVAALGFAGFAAATATYVSGTGYVGYNPVTGVAGGPGVDVAVGGPVYAITSNSSGPAVPALVVTGTSCANASPVIGGTLGTAYLTTGTGTATCTYTITNLPTVNAGYVCIGLDKTTPADVLVQSVSSANGCTLTQSTKASADVVIIFVNGV